MKEPFVYYQHVKVEDVMQYFIKDFEVEEKIVSREWFYDPAKGIVIFKITTEGKPKDDAP